MRERDRIILRQKIEFISEDFAAQAVNWYISAVSAMVICCR